ncbi:MAG: hypothetical protein CUN57_02730, partial [Phototrophicales bacterium]
MRQVFNRLPKPLRFRANRVRFAAVASMTFAVLIGVGINKSYAEIISGFPDGIVFTFTTGSVPGPRVFYLVSDQDDGGGREIVYRQPRDGSNLDFRFDDTGSFVSDTVT